jgi:hypothetical protein
MTPVLLPFTRLASPPPAADVIDVLCTDHDEIAVLFAAIADLARDATRAADARSLVKTLVSAVTLHDRAEERIVYAVCAEWGVTRLRDLARSGTRDHDSLASALAALGGLAPGPDGALEAALRTAQAIFERHRETEEDELFSTMELAFGADERLAMGRAVVVEKERLRAEAGAPAPVERRRAWVR